MAGEAKRRKNQKKKARQKQKKAELKAATTKHEDENEEIATGTADTTVSESIDETMMETMDCSIFSNIPNEDNSVNEDSIPIVEEHNDEEVPVVENDADIIEEPKEIVTVVEPPENTTVEEVVDTVQEIQETAPEIEQPVVQEIIIDEPVKNKIHDDISAVHQNNVVEQEPHVISEHNENKPKDIVQLDREIENQPQVSENTIIEEDSNVVTSDNDVTEPIAVEETVNSMETVEDQQIIETPVIQNLDAAPVVIDDEQAPENGSVLHMTDIQEQESQEIVSEPMSNQEPMKDNNIESLFDNDDEPFLGHNPDNTVVHTELSHNSVSNINHISQENITAESQEIQPQQSNNLFSDDNNMEIETMPWEQETREPIELQAHEQTNETLAEQIPVAETTERINIPKEQPATVHSELFNHHINVQPIEPVHELTQEEITNIPNNEPQNLNVNVANNLFGVNDGTDDELLPWEVNEQIPSEINQSSKSHEENTNVEISNVTNEIRSDAIAPIESSAETVEITPKNNFSFMDEDEDLLEDDDSYLDSEEELELPQNSTPQETQPTTVVSVQASISEPVAQHKASKYAPQTVQTTNQQEATQFDRTGIVQPPAMMFNNTAPSPQMIVTPLGNTAKASFTAQKTAENIKKAKQKSDAYDFPSDLIAPPPKPIHAKPVATPSLRYGSIPSMDMNTPRSRKPSMPYSPLQTSAAPPPMLHRKRDSQPFNSVTSPVVGPPSNRSRLSSGVNMMQPQMNLYNNGQSSGTVPIPRPRATSNLSTGNMSVIPPATNAFIPPLSPQAEQAPSNMVLPVKKSKYAPAVVSQQQPPMQTSQYPQANVGYQPNQPLLNVNTWVPPQGSLPPNQVVSSTINDMTGPPINQMNSQIGQVPNVAPNMGNMGDSFNNPTNQRAHSSKYAPMTQNTNHMPPTGNMPNVQAIQHGYEPQGYMKNTQISSVSRTDYTNGLGINTQGVPFGRNSTQRNSAENQELLARQFPVFSWGKSNKIVYGIPTGNSMYSGTGFSLNSVNVVNYDTILKPSEMMKTFIGPLTSKTKKQDLEKWVDTTLSKIPNTFPDTESLLWGILKCHIHGALDFISVSNMLCDSATTRMYLGQPFMPPKPIANASRIDLKTQGRILALLQIGNYEDALNVALECQDFTMAVLVGSLAGKEKWSSVVDSYLRTEIQGSSDASINVLSLLFQVFVGNSRNAIANFYRDEEHRVWALKNWIYITDVILANVKSVSENSILKPGQLPPMILEFLVEFGMFLSRQNMNLESNVLFVIANVPFSSTPVIPGNDIYFKYIGEPTTTESVIWSEIYEYSKTFAEPEFKGYPTLLAQKLHYGFSLEEEGLSSQASKYNEYVTSKIKQLPRRDASAANLMNSSNILTAKISNSSTGWLGKPKLSSVWGQLDKSFNKYIGGDVDNKPNQTPEKDAFGTFTPYTSNHSSVIDLDQQNVNHFPPQMNYRPQTHTNHQPITSGSVLTMEHMKNTPHRTFGEQSPYAPVSKISESLHGSPGRTYGNDLSSNMAIPMQPLPRVQSEIFETKKVVPPPIIRGDTSNLVLQRSITHDQSKLAAVNHAAELKSDIADLGPPQSFSKQRMPTGPSPGPPRRSSNVSMHSDMTPPPPKARSHKGKTSAQYQPRANFQLIDQLTSLQNTPSTTSLSTSVPPITGPPATATVNTSTGLSLPSEVIPLNPAGPKESATVTTETTHINKEQSAIPPIKTYNQPAETEVDEINVEQEVDSAAPGQEDEVSENIVSEVHILPLRIEQDINDNESGIQSETITSAHTVVEHEETITTELKNDVGEVADTNIKPSNVITTDEKLDTIDSITANLHGRTEFSENEDIMIEEPIASRIIEKEEPISDIPVSEPVKEDITPVDISKKTLKIEPTTVQEDIQVEEDITEEVPTTIDGTSNETTSKSQPETHQVSAVQEEITPERPVEVSRPPAIPTQRKYSAVKKTNSYAPSNVKAKPKTKNNPYAPKNSSSNEPLTVEQLPEPSAGEIDMYSFGGYSAGYSTTQPESVEEIKEPELNVNSPYMPQNNTPQSNYSPVQYMATAQDNFAKQSFSNDKFGPIREADEISNETFEPVIKKNTDNKFNAYTPQVNNSEYNDVIESESDSEEEKSNKKENKSSARKNTTKSKRQNDGSDEDKNGWFGWLKKDTGEKKAIKAKLGNENSFYYDKDLKRWINKNATEEEKKEMAAASKPGPPPPIIKRKDAGPTSSPRVSVNQNSAPPPSSFTRVLPTDPLTGKPMMRPPSTSTASDSSSVTAESSSRLSSNPNIDSLVGKKANDLDDLLKVSASVNRGGKRKKKANRGYVNAM